MATYEYLSTEIDPILGPIVQRLSEEMPHGEENIRQAIARLALSVNRPTLNQAFLFIKPHACIESVGKNVVALVEKGLAAAQIKITAKGTLDAQTIDEKMLIDTHYGAIASKAVVLQPNELVVSDKAQANFKKNFGISWSEALNKGMVFNAMGACAKLGLDAKGIEAQWKTLTDKTRLKFGGGFYCGKLNDSCFVINAFYMSMRAMYTTPPAKINYYLVEWDPKVLSWEDFRGKIIGPTNPSVAPVSSLRGSIFADWKALGLKEEPNTGLNGVHASAGPFEGLAERLNWCGSSVENDAFGSALLRAGVSLSNIMAFTKDPQVNYNDGSTGVFDLLEDVNAAECIEKLKGCSLPMYDVLSKQDSVTSNWIINSLANDPVFAQFGDSETKSILARDAEDDEKLAAGIKIAVDKGVLKAISPPPYTKVDVLGKTADAVADEIISGCGSAASTGCVIVLCGLSGTGKGTTVAKLMEKVPKAVSWSNGNVFRSMTMLASLYCKQNKIDFSEAVLTAENLKSWMGMLKFGKFNGEYDIQIKGLGVDTFVNKIKNTDLKGALVKPIPTVAQATQGEVVKFASDATNTMSKDGYTVILEGRAQTVNYVDTKYRFELTMSDPSLIGKRRAAQRIAASAMEDCAAGADDAAVTASVKSALSKLV
jgi:cytidylate kinase